MSFEIERKFKSKNAGFSTTQLEKVSPKQELGYSHVSQRLPVPGRRNHSFRAETRQMRAKISLSFLNTFNVSLPICIQPPTSRQKWISDYIQKLRVKNTQFFYSFNVSLRAVELGGDKGTTFLRKTFEGEPCSQSISGTFKPNFDFIFYRRRFTAIRGQLPTVERSTGALALSSAAE